MSDLVSVPPLPRPYIQFVEDQIKKDDPDAMLHEVRALGTRQGSIAPIVLLNLEVPLTSDQTVIHRFGLSLPAAARLARMLDKAVQENLYGPEVEE